MRQSRLFPPTPASSSMSAKVAMKCCARVQGSAVSSAPTGPRSAGSPNQAKKTENQIPSDLLVGKSEHGRHNDSRGYNGLQTPFHAATIMAFSHQARSGTKVPYTVGRWCCDDIPISASGSFSYAGALIQMKISRAEGLNLESFLLSNPALGPRPTLFGSPH